jgi:uncharacterized protein
LFKSPSAFASSKVNSFDALLIDEAHRLTSDVQIKQIISVSKLSLFFIDEDQRVTLKDI